MDVAALRLRDSILTSAETEGLTYQAYWLSTTLALGAFLKVCAPYSASFLALIQHHFDDDFGHMYKLVAHYIPPC